jgi:hypothetical protein
MKFKHLNKEKTLRLKNTSYEVDKFSFKIAAISPSKHSIDSVLKTTTATTPSYCRNKGEESLSSSFLVYNKINNNVRDSTKDPFLNYEFID